MVEHLAITPPSTDYTAAPSAQLFFTRNEKILISLSQIFVGLDLFSSRAPESFHEFHFVITASEIHCHGAWRWILTTSHSLSWFAHAMSRLYLAHPYVPVFSTHSPKVKDFIQGRIQRDTFCFPFEVSRIFFV